VIKNIILRQTLELH